jgi:hypothetical protein
MDVNAMLFGRESLVDSPHFKYNVALGPQC